MDGCEACFPSGQTRIIYKSVAACLIMASGNAFIHAILPCNPAITTDPQLINQIINERDFDRLLLQGHKTQSQEENYLNNSKRLGDEA